MIFGNLYLTACKRACVFHSASPPSRSADADGGPSSSFSIPRRLYRDARTGSPLDVLARGLARGLVKVIIYRRYGIMTWPPL